MAGMLGELLAALQNASHDLIWILTRFHFR